MKFSSFRNWSVRAKIVSISALTMVIFLVLIQVYFFGYLRSRIISEKKEALTGSTEILFSILNAYEQRANEGEFTREEAKRRALRNIEKLRYQGDNYFWISDITPVMIMHPHRKDLNGRDISDYADENGKKLFLEFVAGCRKDGYAYVKYRWPNSKGEMRSKMGMAMYYKPWGWIIGTGLDIDRLNKEISDTSLNMTIIYLVFAIINMLIAFMIADYITKPIRKVMEALNSIAGGEYGINLPEAGEDETGHLVKCLNNVSNRLKDSFEQLNKTTDELKNASRQLEMKNSELERFTYSVSHDLKSPLITIKGFCGLLEEDLESQDTDRIKKDLAKIVKSADRMEALLDDLLTLSRIGQVVNPPQKVSLDELVKEVIEILTGVIRKKGVKITVPENLPEVVADRPRLSQVIQNLLENAIKFTEEAENPTVEIGTRNSENKVLFYIKDNGIGIDPRHHKKIFELFNRLDTKTPGSGVGLAMAKRIIEVHGGKIWVESDGNGTGSTFCFTLPETEK